MMISTKKGFGFVCVPKCGSTSIQAAIRPYCSVLMTNVPRLKHMTYSEAEEFLLPLLEFKELPRPHMFAVVRDPIDWVGSWYRYRARDGQKGDPHFSGNVSFDEFAKACCLEKPPGFARIRNQKRFLVDKNGEVAVDSLLPYEHLNHALETFLGKFGVKVKEVPRLNVSPSKKQRKTELSGEAMDMLRKHFAEDIEIHKAAVGPA